MRAGQVMAAIGLLCLLISAVASTGSFASVGISLLLIAAIAFGLGWFIEADDKLIDKHKGPR